MGMFDYVVSEVPLPDEWDLTNDHVGLQTKDFDCTMTTVRISAEGRLLIERFEYYTLPKEERTYPDAPEDTWQSVCGMLGKRDRRWVDLNYHGDFYFGGLEDLKDDHWHESPSHRNGGWMQKRFRKHSYIARFTNGHLEALRVDGPAASADTHPKDGDVKQAPLVSGAVPDRADAQTQPPSPRSAASVQQTAAKNHGG